MEGTILQRDQARACACHQQQQVGEGSETPATDDLELDDEGFGVKQVKEVMLLSMEGLKPERERHLQRGRASSPPRAKKKAAAPGKHTHFLSQYECRKPTVVDLVPNGS